MYYRHFGLDGPPFRFTPSPTLFLGPAHRECLAALEWALLHDQCGFMLLLGETGTGKTTLLNSVLARSLPNLKLAWVPNPKLSFVEIMRVVLPQLGVATRETGKLELIQALERALANRPLGSRTAIVIDEAQNLSDDTLEDLRLLSNSCGGQDRELQFVLMGHPELLDRLAARHLRQLRERISTKVTLPALTANESIAYIRYRLQAQNGSARIFEADAIKYLIEAAAGVPRRLNVLCHNALLLAYSKNLGAVRLDVAREVVADYKDIFLPSNDKLHPELDRAAPTEVRPAAIRRRPRLVLAAAACAALAVIGFGGVMLSAHEWNGVQRRDEVPVSRPAIAPAPITGNQIHKPSPVEAEKSPASVVTAPPEPTIIRIRQGDTFHDLAAKYLGSKDRARELINANPQIKNPNSLFVGQIIFLPAKQPTDLAGVVQ
jgi:type II secretory pathway predicted ATPase ExeA